MQRQMAEWYRYALVSAWVLLFGATASWSQSLIWLGTLGGYPSEAWDISDDGSVIVGYSRNPAGYRRAFRWTRETGMQDLGTLGGNESWAFGVSADGNVIVGAAQNAAGRFRAFRWTQATGMQELGTLTGSQGSQSWAYDVSADGRVVVGWSHSVTGYEHAFRWTADGGMQDLGTLSEYVRSFAYGVSADGSVVVGESGDSGQGYGYAFRWTQSTGMQSLGLGRSSVATAASRDGAIVVGWVSNTGAFRWTQEGGVQYLPRPTGSSSSVIKAYGVSADGSTIVGMVGDGGAVRWTQSGGEILSRTYSSLLRGNAGLMEARAVTSYGRYIVGWGAHTFTGATRNEAYLLDTQPSCNAHNGDVDRSGCVDDADLLAVLFAFGNTGDDLGRVDTNCDGVVDDADLLIALFNFGNGC